MHWKHILVAVGAIAGIATSVTTASAWSGTTRAPRTGYLPGTYDYIQTNTWMGTDYAGSAMDGWFNWQSSSYLYGSYPWNAYWIEDQNTLQVNGIGVSISNTGVGASASPGQITYTSRSYNNWYAGNVGYNEHWEAFAFWNLTSNDRSNVQVWQTGSAVHNTAAATKWW